MPPTGLQYNNNHNRYSSYPLIKLICNCYSQWRSQAELLGLIDSSEKKKTVVHFHAKEIAHLVLYIIYTYATVVIFKGSCGPLYSSPRTRGNIIPGLALLICGWWSAWETSNLRISVTRNACISITLSKRLFSASPGERMI